MKIPSIINLPGKMDAGNMPATIEIEVQAAMILAELDDLVEDLLEHKISLPVIMISLFSSWLHIEEKITDANKNDILLKEDKLAEKFKIVTNKVKAILVKLPDIDLKSAAQQPKNKKDILKKPLSTEQENAIFNIMQSVQAIKVNSIIFDRCSDLLKDYTPLVLANMLFSLWVRLSILNNDIYDARIAKSAYQKIGHYFKDVINEIRMYLPELF